MSSMPLVEMSPNLQADALGRKRSHDEFSAEAVKGSNGSINPPNPVLPSPPGIVVNSPLENTSPASMTDGGRSTPGRNSPSPNPTPTHVASPSSFTGQPSTTTTSTTSTTTTNPTNPTNSTTPAAPNPSDQPPAKRKRLTSQEKATKAEEDARRKKEREDQRQQKAAEKAKQDAEKALAKQARAAEKAKREVAEQEAKAAKQQERDEKRRKKEEEERRAREAAEKKARSQMRMTNFFKAGAATTPKKVAAEAGVVGDAAGSPCKEGTPKREETSYYDRLFNPFFVKDNVRLAPTSVPMDKETVEAKGRILEEYVNGERGADVPVHPFRPVEALQLVSKPRRRGVLHPPVRSLMEDLQDSSRAPAALAKLRTVPVKLLCFRQDVRPPYYGTLTCLPHQAGESALRRLARRPNARILDLAYDYDSEAEWQDDEPGDDLDDMDDEEEDVDDEDDMDGFLDDSEDAGVARRIFANSMEPDSTGVCFEDEGIVDRLRPMRLEIILESLDAHASIDPFSTDYWAPKKPPKALKATMPPPPAPSNAFEALGAKTNPTSATSTTATPATARTATTTGDATAGKPQVKINLDLLPAFKKAVLANQKLSKMAIVEVLAIQMGEGVGKAEAKAMLELVAEKKSVKGLGRVWVLKEGQ